MKKIFFASIICVALLSCIDQRTGSTAPAWTFEKVVFSMPLFFFPVFLNGLPAGRLSPANVCLRCYTTF